MKRKFNPYLLVAWIVSIIATLGSLYFSEIRQFTPCDWCWYQRILMYPMMVLLGIATFKNDLSIKHYLLPLSVLGFLIGTMHYLQQKVSIFGEVCRSTVPCSIQYIDWLGFITIPFLSLTAFGIITFALLQIKKNKG